VGVAIRFVARFGRSKVRALGLVSSGVKEREANCSDVEKERLDTRRDRSGAVRGSKRTQPLIRGCIVAYLPIFCASLCMFCYVLYPSSSRWLAAPWTYFLHLSLSSVVLIDSSTMSPVHVLMLYIQAVRAPDIVPCVISFSRHLACFLMV